MKRKKGGFMSIDAIVILIGIVALVIGIGYSFLKTKSKDAKENSQIELLEARIRSLEITRNEMTKELEENDSVDTSIESALKDVEQDVSAIQEDLLKLVQQIKGIDKEQEKKIALMKADIEASLRHLPTTIELALKKFPTKIELVKSPERAVIQTEVKKTKTGYTKTIKKFSRPVKRKSKKKVRLADNLPRMNQ